MSVGQFAFLFSAIHFHMASGLASLVLLALSGWIEVQAAIVAAQQNFSLPSFAAVAYIAWASTLFGYAVWNYLLSRHPVNRIAPFTLLVPLVGLNTGWLVFGESLQWIHFAGGALLMMGLLVNLFGARLIARFR